MDFGHQYLTSQLIAYIGNKRALVPFLHGVFSSLPLDPSRCTFLDPFAGSGSVSRLARMMGYRVAANDWEPYARCLNSCFLGLRPSDLHRMFRERGGFDAVLEALNNRPFRETDAYISKFYAPRNTDSADWRTERLFYTTENARVIDAIREGIEEILPGEQRDQASFGAKAALLAPLLYEAATHTNTSGVFKACHKGFGGHGRDALGRIMGRVMLRRPVLTEGAPAEVACTDAAAFLSARAADLCYLDPPYAVHQYGSNYFMLNSIALWDKPPVSDERTGDGRFRHKAGIRPDWTRTRSAFCSRDTAVAAMKAVVEAADCRWLVVSYSNEGLIGLEELCDLLAATGALTLRSTGYGKYPGGKQSLHRTTRNMELALVVQRDAPVRVPSRAADTLQDVRIARLMALSFDPARIRRSFPVKDNSLVAGDDLTLLPMRHFWRFLPDSPMPRFASAEAAEAFIMSLSACAAHDVRDEIDILVRCADSLEARDQRERRRLLREILRLLNRLAHRKYRVQFGEALSTLRAAALAGHPAEPAFLAGLDAIEKKAGARIAAR